MDLNDREHEIIKLADSFLKRVDKQELDEATIDSNFIFRFEPNWCRGINQIRGGMRNMIGKSGNDPLSNDDAVRWLLHFENNTGLYISLQGNGKSISHYIHTDSGRYSCLDKALQRQLDNGLLPSPSSGDRFDDQRVRMARWYEANQTSKIIKEIECIALNYSLIPSVSESKYYSEEAIETMWKSILNWVIWGQIVPEFLFEKTIFIETKLGEGIQRRIQLFGHPKGSWEIIDNISDQGESEFVRKDNIVRKPGERVWRMHEYRERKRMMRDTRIRTWAIYFLSRRGGGRLPEEKAVNTWSKIILPDAPPLLPHNYQHERNRLLSRGSIKKP